MPQQINNDGEREFVGYCLAIPEVADLELFCEDYPELLHNLSTEVKGFRPAEAVIDLPAQARWNLWNTSPASRHLRRRKSGQPIASIPLSICIWSKSETT